MANGEGVGHLCLTHYAGINVPGLSWKESDKVVDSRAIKVEAFEAEEEVVDEIYDMFGDSPNFYEVAGYVRNNFKQAFVFSK